MTNFEKWKQELTVEQAARLIALCCCDDCPARDKCKDVYYGCTDFFKEWANSPVEGTNKPSEDKGKENILRNLDEAIMGLNEAKNDIALIKELIKNGNG